LIAPVYVIISVHFPALNFLCHIELRLN